MTLTELREDHRIWLRAEDISEVLAASPQTIRDQAQQNPAMLGFPVTVLASTVRIPRIPFLRFLGLTDTVLLEVKPHAE